ncbi:unnamed protein product [Porites lobata]|uniref:Ras-GEF domain-containing protein n=1 Tax=Porites lobata TaxID=104759 RepID=A0ABN8PAB5_9CNID|nr:unnamed protein product [Porites lobata]
MDPSRNMSKYRNLLNGKHGEPPLIPFFPVITKDLTFIHLGNDSIVDGLVNFEKLRLIAREVRQISSLTPSHTILTLCLKTIQTVREVLVTRNWLAW